ncbi:MAG: protein kinase [Phycisphaerae bacterium]|nr:protein kinase [Phycisphaerae bacterium]
MGECLSLEELERLSELQADSPLLVSQPHLQSCSVCRARLEEVRKNLSLFETCLEFGSDFIKTSGERWSEGSSADGEASPEAGVDEGGSATTPGIEGYELLHEIHRGAQGVVYKAVQCKTGHTLALKVLLRGPYATGREQRRFEREIELVARLEHPNIVRLYDRGKANGRHYFAMEFVEGLPLRDHWVVAGLDVRETLGFFLKICKAIGYAHSRGIMHRDLKPSNIFVDEGGEPRILDFGIAKPIGQETIDTLTTQTGGFMGTLAYASPEQAACNPDAIDARTDVYALGVILYELLTGRRPYPTDEGVPQVLRHIVETEPSRPSRYNGLLDDEVDTIVLKALEKDPDRRYTTANSLANDIERYLSGRPIEAKPYSGLYVLRKTLARHKAISVLSACLLLSLVVFAAVTTVSARRLAVERDRAVSAEELARREAEAAQRSLYLNRVHLAYNAFQRSDTAQMKEMLQACPKEFRGWEWSRLAWLSDRSLLTYTGHVDDVRFVKFSEDGKYVASLAETGGARVWDPVTGETRGAISKVKATSGGMRLAPSGELVFAFDRDDSLCLWTITDEAPLLKFGGDQVAALAFSSDSRYFAVSERDAVSVWDVSVRPPRVCFKAADEEVKAFEFARDGAKLVGAGWDGAVFVWRLPDGSLLRTFKDRDARSLAVSRDGTRYASFASGTVNVWDLDAAKRLFTLDADLPGDSRADFSQDGKRVWMRYRGGLIAKAWDVRSGRLLAERVNPRADFTYPSQEWGYLANVPDGTLQIVSAATDEVMAILHGHTGFIRDVCASPDGTRLVTASDDDTCKVWDPRDIGDARTWVHDVALEGVALSPDGGLVAACGHGRSVDLWRSDVIGEPVLTLRGHRDRVSSVAFSPDGTRLVSACAGDDANDHTARVWEVASGRQLRVLEGHTGGVSCAAFSRDGRRIVTGSWDHTVRVWDAGTGETLHTLTHPDEVWDLDLSNDGLWIVAGGKTGVLCLWEYRTGRLVRSLAGHTDAVDAVAFSPDSSHLVSGDNDGHLICWNVADGQRVWLTRTRLHKIYCALYTPDGRRIITGSHKKISVLEADTGRLVLSWDAHDGPILAMDMSVDGRALVSVGGSALKLWPALALE